MGDLLAQEKAAIVVWRLAHGEALLTSEIADLTDMSRQGAWSMMTTISRVIPIWCDLEGKWRAASTGG